MLKKHFYILLFLVILVLSLGRFIFSDHEFMIGHNWDWVFPATKDFFTNLYRISFYSWWSVDFGSPTNTNITHIIPDAGMAVLSYLFTPKTAVILLLVSVISLSFFSFKKLLDLIISLSQTNYIPAILFAFSPFLFNEIIGGSWYMWIAYAFSPLYFIYHLKYIKSGGVWNLLIFLLSSVFVISSLQDFVLLEFLCLFYSIYAFWGQPILLFKRLTVIYVSLILSNFYWIYPFLLSLQSYSNTVLSSSFTGQFISTMNSTQNLFSIFNISGYLDRNIYYFAVPKLLVQIFNFSVFTLWAIIIYVLFITKKHQAGIVFWIPILLVGILVVKGGNSPFSVFSMWLFRHFPLLGLYRSPQHLMFLSALTIPVLVGFVSNYFAKSRLRYLILLFVIIWISGWWTNGDLGKATLYEQKMDHVDFYTLPKEIVQLYELSETEKSVHRISFLPTVISPTFIDRNGVKLAQGGQSEYLYLRNPTFTAEANGIAKSIDNHFCKGEVLDLAKVMAYSNVKYVATRADILPLHTECQHIWNNEASVEMMNKDTRFEKLFSGPDSSVFILKDNYFLPRIYIPTSVEIAAPGKTAYIDKISDPKFIVGDAVYQTEDSHNNISIGSKLSAYKAPLGAKVDFKRVNPTKYEITVSNVSGEFPLVFLENFNPSWKLFKGVSGDGFNDFVSRLTGKPLGDDHHFKTNYYANGWLLNVDSLCSDNTTCINNPDGTVNINLSLEFAGQQRLYVGLALSVSFLLLLISSGL